MSECKLIAKNRCFGGIQERYQHYSHTTNCEMTFSVYKPPAVVDECAKVPAVFWLSGLTCTDENFVQKAGAQRYAADLGLMIIAPDTSPRGHQVPDDENAEWDFGLGAGFYVNATRSPWKEHYQMFDYVNRELPQLIAAQLPWDGKASISGHSMGGHGALISALKLPQQYASVSAFSPIVNPSQCPWGKKAFHHYLGNNKDDWSAYDACELIEKHGLSLPCLIDQGSDDEFLEKELKTNNLQTIAKNNDAKITLNYRNGYDHSYFFISSFIGEHLRFHKSHIDDSEND